MFAVGVRARLHGEVDTHHKIHKLASGVVGEVVGGGILAFRPRGAGGSMYACKA